MHAHCCPLQSRSGRERKKQKEAVGVQKRCEERRHKNNRVRTVSGKRRRKDLPWCRKERNVLSIGVFTRLTGARDSKSSPYSDFRKGSDSGTKTRPPTIRYSGLLRSLLAGTRSCLVRWRRRDSRRRPEYVQTRRRDETKTRDKQDRKVWSRTPTHHGRRHTPGSELHAYRHTRENR